jgi:hypothetical protein
MRRHKVKNPIFEGAIAAIGGITQTAAKMHKSVAFLYQRRTAGGFDRIRDAREFLKICREVGMRDLHLLELFEPEAPVAKKRLQPVEGLRAAQ